jgi:hypothetical protein
MSQRRVIVVTQALPPDGTFAHAIIFEQTAEYLAS